MGGLVGSKGEQSDGVIRSIEVGIVAKNSLAAEVDLEDLRYSIGVWVQMSRWMFRTWKSFEMPMRIQKNLSVMEEGRHTYTCVMGLHDMTDGYGVSFLGRL